MARGNSAVPGPDPPASRMDKQICSTDHKMIILFFPFRFLPTSDANTAYLESLSAHSLPPSLCRGWTAVPPPQLPQEWGLFICNACVTMVHCWPNKMLFVITSNKVPWHIHNVCRRTPGWNPVCWVRVWLGRLQLSQRSLTLLLADGQHFKMNDWKASRRHKRTDTRTRGTGNSKAFKPLSQFCKLCAYSTWTGLPPQFRGPTPASQGETAILRPAVDGAWCEASPTPTN